MDEERLNNLKEGQTDFGPKLNEEQRGLILRWVAAGFTNRTILSMCRRYGFPSLTNGAIGYYRSRYSDSTVAEERKKFIETALNEGWADRKNRVELLSAMLEDWTGRSPDMKEVEEMRLKIEKQLSERVDEPSLQKVQLSFDEPQTMKDLVGD